MEVRELQKRLDELNKIKVELKIAKCIKEMRDLKDTLRKNHYYIDTVDDFQDETKELIHAIEKLNLNTLDSNPNVNIPLLFIILFMILIYFYLQITPNKF